MVIEHIFITTLERDDALVLADVFFTDLGLTRSSVRNANEWSAGRDRPRKLTEFKHTVRIDFDRGRITLGASAPAIQATSSVEKLYAPYMLALASCLEAHISHAQPVDEAAAPVRAALEALRKRERRSSITALIVVGAFVLLIAGIVIAIVLTTP
jgi:hypothetical protein